jgi:hypothetical protein
LVCLKNSLCIFNEAIVHIEKNIQYVKKSSLCAYIEATVPNKKSD